jgi:DNA-binding MarR family transcriptional regulator
VASSSPARGGFRAQIGHCFAVGHLSSTEAFIEDTIQQVAARGKTPPGRSPDQDHVDRVRAQWHAVRPDLDTSPAGIVARVGRLAAYFDQSTNALMARYGLTRSTWDILVSLRRSGPPYRLTPTELYRALMRSSGWMTNRLHDLEDAGLIVRRPDPADKRGVLVELTQDGLRLVDEVVEYHLENERRLVGELPEAERDQLAALLRTLLRAHEELDLDPPGARRPRRTRRRR